MKILVIGDIIGKPGRNTTKTAIQFLKDEYSFDLIIANGENLAHGTGMTPRTYKEMKEAGINFFTTGNHIYSKGEIFKEMDKKKTRIIRPANFPEGNVGHGYQIISIKKKKVLIINLMGRVFMDRSYDCPFKAMDRILKETKKEKPDAVLVDFHAEATSEKIALKHYLDGKVTALWGTHTHVQTADEEVTEKGTAYITDVGMVGSYDSIIGMKKDSIIESFLKQTSFKMEMGTEPCIFNAIMIEKLGTKKAKTIKRFFLHL